MPLDGKSIERVPEPATHEPTLIGFLEELESTDLSQGVCSRRVQQLIHSIHSQIYNMTASELVEAKVHNPTTAFSKNRNLYPVGDTLGEWRLLASEEGEPGEVIQRIYIAKAVPSDGLLQAVHAFTLLERANNDGCSVSLFNLGLVEDLDWKTVATQADETRPITIDEALSDLPQTNAAVLDQLTAVASGQMRFTQTSLEETLQLLALWQYLFPKAAIENKLPTTSRSGYWLLQTNRRLVCPLSCLPWFSM